MIEKLLLCVLPIVLASIFTTSFLFGVKAEKELKHILDELDSYEEQ